MKYWTIDKATREIIGHGDTDKWNMPRNVLLVEPLPSKEGFAVVANADLSGTEYVEDHRGKTIYNTQDCKESKTVEKLGVVEEGWTLLKPSTQFDEWIDGAWVTNEQAQYEAHVKQVDATRRSLYLNVDALRNEAAMIRMLEENETKAVDYDEQAKALYLKIRDENPWPEPPEE